MGTFLVTRKMAPELAARIERSVRAPRRYTFFGVGPFVAFVIVAALILAAACTLR